MSVPKQPETDTAVGLDWVPEKTREIKEKGSYNGGDLISSYYYWKEEAIAMGDEVSSSSSSNNCSAVAIDSSNIGFQVRLSHYLIIVPFPVNYFFWFF